MEKIDDAIGRLGAAVGRLEAAMDAMPDRASKNAAAPVEASEDHAKLEAEVMTLRARAEEDAKLRAEAASAVRAALTDLRSAVTRQVEGGTPANA
ncbi:MAG: hypothetical protein AAF439_09650 [Pseudomonadota bacterium]